ncbi:MAG: peptidoglycan-binding protein [Actinomycetota bacterium]
MSITSPDHTPAPMTNSQVDTAANAPLAPGDPGPAGDTVDPGRRRWPLVLVAVAALGVAGAGSYVLATGDDGSDDPTDAPATIRAVTAEQRDLIEFTDLDGTLGYATTRSVSAAEAGTITAVVDDGATVTRGDVIYELDAEPVVLFNGDVPLYRPLTEGDEGDDVELLEANLASLGYHLDQDADDLADGDDEVDTGFTVDGVYDAATTDAVERWQADVGLDETGDLDLGDVIVAEGPVVVSAGAVEVGSVVQTGAPIVDLNVTGTVETFHAAAEGELELLATSGPVTNGQVLYTVDELPVTAVVVDPADADDLVFDRTLSEGVADGDDVRALEEMLVTIGYDARGDLDPDDEFDDVTAEAVEDWQEDLQDTWDDVVVDGTVSPDDLVVVEAGTVIGTVTDRPTSVVATGSELFTWTTDGGGRIVATAIDVAEQDKLSEGAEVDVEFPDGTTVVGIVTDVASSSTIDPTDPDAEAQLAVEIAIAEVPASAAGLIELDVEVKLVDELAAGATVVPASALVVTADGGYAVEVVDAAAGTTSFVAVDPGMFADGFVEVDGIAPGTAVVVPS